MANIRSRESEQLQLTCNPSVPLYNRLLVLAMSCRNHRLSVRHLYLLPKYMMVEVVTIILIVVDHLCNRGMH